MIKFIISLFFLFAIATPSFSDFIIDDDRNEEDVKINEKVSDNGTGLAPYVASKIKASKIPGVESSIRITWEVNPGFSGKFIVGRAKSPIDSIEKALKSESIKIISTNEPGLVVDAGLKPGKYYYVVISKTMVKRRSVELYADVNYTTLPVVVSDSNIAGSVKQVSGVRLAKVGINMVKISWDLHKHDGIVYSIYRGTRVLDTKEKLKQADKVAMLVDKGSFVDDGKNISGGVYYAVTSKKLYGKENLELVRDANYVTKKIYIGKKPTSIVKKIQALREGNSIILNWKPLVGQNVKGYAIYRLSREIANERMLSQAVHLGSIDGTFSRYVDRDARPGTYYYAVLAKLFDGKVDMTLQGGANYTLMPVIVKNDYVLTSISAYRDRSKKSVTIKWTYSGESGENIYRLYRSAERILGTHQVDEKKFLREVDILDGMYELESPGFGNYYYYMVPDLPNKRSFLFLKGVNVTLNAISIELDNKPKREVKPRYIQKDKEETEVPKEKKYIEKRIYVPEKKETRIVVEKTKKPTIRRKKRFRRYNIERVIKDTYFDRNYRQAIKELRKIVRLSENKRDVAKAKLFIARSYIAINRYSKAMNYLVQRDLDDYYPKETQFWRDYVIVRVGK